MFSSASSRMYMLSLFLIAVVFMLFPLGAFAAGPDLKDPGSILSWLRLQTMVVTWIVTLIWKTAPVVKNWSNKAAGWIALLVFIVDQLAGNSGVAFAAAAAAPPNLHWTAKISLALLNFGIAKPVWDGLVKPTLGTFVDKWLGRVPQTPHN